MFTRACYYKNLPVGSQATGNFVTKTLASAVAGLEAKLGKFGAVNSREMANIRMI